MASFSVPCLKSSAFQCGSNVAKSLTAGPNFSIRPTARWSVAVAGDDRRSSTFDWADAGDVAPAMPDAARVSADATNVRRSILVVMCFLPI